MARLPLRSPHTPFLPITEYGFISDCNSAALVARDGSIDWLSLPRFDSPAVFARLLDPRAGHFSISPVEEATARRRYRDGSLVLETIFETASGTARLVDAMAFARGQGHDDMGFDVPHEILRLVEGLTGSFEIEVEFAPRPEYGLVRPLIRLESTGARTFGGPNRLAMTSAAPLTLDGATVRARLSIAAGDHAGFALRWAPAEARELEATPHDLVEEQLQVTEAAWRSWQAHHSVYEGPHAEQVHLSSRILQGLTYRPTGAIVAAATTSLPEAAGGERNWDYRFAWIRDASLTLNALYIGACPDEAADFVSFMTSSAGATAGPDAALQIMYGIGGEHDLSERELPHLRGWRDSRPVRVGNGAWSQTQLDVYGELLDAIHLYHDRLGSLHHEIQRFVADLADAAARRWREKDAGMWEMRGEPRDHLSSKLLCWVALDRAVKLAPHLEEHSNSERWSAERDAIRQAIMNRG
ncbi:MAG TPA: glycoside hydrolase family 15 protein, partial [Candidatus Sulfotelmatobacter sp.]|nr:glycoside hydrolase family 15 protein [Candidatus Sulfotelmatobacter sp.]